MSELGWWIVATTVRPVFASVRKVTTTDSAVKLSRLYRLATGKSQPPKKITAFLCRVDTHRKGEKGDRKMPCKGFYWNKEKREMRASGIHDVVEQSAFTRSQVDNDAQPPASGIRP